MTAPGTYRIRALYSHEASKVSFDINGEPAANCQIPVATPSWHYWNVAEVGSITFTSTGKHVLTFHYGKGNNFACFEFVPVAAQATPNQ